MVRDHEAANRQSGFCRGGPLKFRAKNVRGFGCLNSSWGDNIRESRSRGSKGTSELEMADVDKGPRSEVRDRAGELRPAEGRPIAEGDYAQLHSMEREFPGGRRREKISWKPTACCVSGRAKKKRGSLQRKLARRKARANTKNFDRGAYPADYPDPKLQGEKHIHSSKSWASRKKKRPEVNDEFGEKDVSEAQDGRELADQDSQNSEARRSQRPTKRTDFAKRLLAKISAAHEFPATSSARRSTRWGLPGLERTVAHLPRKSGIPPQVKRGLGVHSRKPPKKDRAVEGL